MSSPSSYERIHQPGAGTAGLFRQRRRNNKNPSTVIATASAATTADNNNKDDQDHETFLPHDARAILYGATLRDAAREQRVRLRNGQKNCAWIRTHAAGLNPVDAKRVIGDKLPPTWHTLLGWYDKFHVSRKIVGYDVCGQVVEVVGTSKTRRRRNPNSALSSMMIQPGDMVFGIMPATGRGGSVAEYAQVPLDQLCKVPPSMINDKIQNDSPPDSFQQQQLLLQFAALPLIGLTALQCLQPHIHHPGEQQQQGQQQQEQRVLVLGASGGTGHIATQVAKALGATHVTAVCSQRNAQFCREQAKADTVVAYNDARYTTTGPELFLRDLAAQGPYSVVLDCVTSGDPRDETANYPQLIQQYDKRQGVAASNNNNQQLLTDDYIYRRLGGPFPDWVRAGLQRVSGNPCWWRRNPREQLFWIRMHQSSTELEQLAQWMEQGKLKVHVGKVYDFDAAAVQQALDDLLGRRVRGKVVVQIEKNPVE